MEVDETNWKYPPEFVLDEIFDRLALADLRTASRVCLTWRARAALAAKRWDRLSLTAVHFRWEPVRFLCASVMPGMSPREFHASCYHPKSGKVYVFGGQVPSSGNTAEFNDLWSFDLGRRRWKRVVVRSSPYPMPKSRCSLVAWGDFLVLVGGSRYVGNPNNGPHEPGRSCTREIHRFDTRKKEWIEMWSDSQAPGIFCHSSVVFKHFLIIIGGLSQQRGRGHSPKPHLVHVIDLKLGAWHEPPIVAEPHERSEPFSSAVLAACTSVLLRPGCILLHPSSSPFIDNRLNQKWVAYLLHFDPNDLTQEWRCEMIPILKGDFNFKCIGLIGQIGVVQVNDKARLLHLVSVERKRAVEGGSQMVRRMEAFHSTVRSTLSDHIKSPEDITRFYNSLSTEPFRIKDEGNVYILSQGKSGKQSDIQVTVEPLHLNGGAQQSPAEVNLNVSFIQFSFLPAELRSEGWSVCEQAIRLHSRTATDEMILISANLDRVEEEKQLRWTLCDMRGEAPPVTAKYSFVSAGGQMVLHGGSFRRGRILCNGACSGGTYVLDPVAA